MCIRDSPRAEPLVDGPQAEVSNAVNANIVSRVMEARAHLEGWAPFAGAREPPPGGEGGRARMAPFDSQQCANALKQNGSYTANGNLRWLDITKNVAPGVPVNNASIKTSQTQ
eukprot:4778667-Pyramimonas_sp.AAC.1